MRSQVMPLTVSIMAVPPTLVIMHTGMFTVNSSSARTQPAQRVQPGQRLGTAGARDAPPSDETVKLVTDGVTSQIW